MNVDENREKIGVVRFEFTNLCIYNLKRDLVYDSQFKSFVDENRS